MSLRIDDGNRRWWIVGAMGGVLALVVLDETVVGVALPTIRRDLGMSQLSSHWVVNAYVLVFTGLAAAAGKLHDQVDVKRLFLTGLALFGVASLATGLARDVPWILAARSVQGVGAAILFPLSVAMITHVFPEEERGVAFGIHTACGGTAMALGPLVGGFLTETFSWRWIFWVNLPIVLLVALVVARARVETPRAVRAPPLDRPGLVAFVLGLGALVTGLMQAPDWGWSAPVTLALLGGGGALLVVFVAIELRVRAPLIELDLARDATFAGCSLVMLTGQLGKFTVVVFGALYLQQRLGFSALTTGLAMLPGVAPLAFMPLVAGKLTDRLGPRGPALAGLALNAAALGGLGLAASAGRYELIVAPLVLWGATLPFLYVAPRHAIMRAVPADEQGAAGGLNLTAQLLGGVIGMTLGGTLLVTTGDFRVVFLASAGIAVLTLAVAARAIRTPRAPLVQASRRETT